MTGGFDVTVLISTRNRRDELSRALDSVKRQSVPAEILVFDDASEDGTAEWVRSAFPAVRLERSDERMGIVGARDRAMRIAGGKIVITIDDDCVMVSPETVERTVADFCDPRIGAVAIPSVDFCDGGQRRFGPEKTDGVWLAPTFRGGASAILREAFDKVGGFDTTLFRQGEEGDFCMGLLREGYVCRWGTAPAIEHYPMGKRDVRLIGYYQARNSILWVFRYAPIGILGVHLMIVVGRLLRSGVARRCTAATVSGVVSGLVEGKRVLSRRRGVDPRAYRLVRLLSRKSPVLLDEARLLFGWSAS